MSEHQLSDTVGRFSRVVQNERRLQDAEWETGRIILSNKRLVLVSEDGKRTIPLSEVTAVGGQYNVNQSISQESNYLAIKTAEDVVLIATQSPEEFETDLYSGLLDQEVILLKHPAVRGGVVQETEWEKARIKIDSSAINIATASGSFVEVILENVIAVTSEMREVKGEPRSVIEVEHTEEGTNLETYFSGTERQISLLETLMQTNKEENETRIELDTSERQILMALYSGISPLDVPEFTELEVEEVESTFEELIEKEVLQEVRVRREVELTSRGRTLAGQAMEDE